MLSPSWIPAYAGMTTVRYLTAEVISPLFKGSDVIRTSFFAIKYTEMVLECQEKLTSTYTPLAALVYCLARVGVLMFQLIQALYPAPGSFQHRHAPRAPLPDRGVTSCSVMFLHHVGKRYPPFIAHTGSCAKPNSSRRLRLTITADLCRLSLVPAGSWPFPTLSLQSLRRRLDPLPRSVPLVRLLASSQKTMASPQT